MTGPDDIRRGGLAQKDQEGSGGLPTIFCDFTVAIDAAEIEFCSLSRLCSETAPMSEPVIRATLRGSPIDMEMSCCAARSAGTVGFTIGGRTS